MVKMSVHYRKENWLDKLSDSVIILFIVCVGRWKKEDDNDNNDRYHNEAIVLYSYCTPNHTVTKRRAIIIYVTKMVFC